AIPVQPFLGGLDGFVFFGKQPFFLGVLLPGDVLDRVPRLVFTQAGKDIPTALAGRALLAPAAGLVMWLIAGDRCRVNKRRSLQVQPGPAADDPEWEPALYQQSPGPQIAALSARCQQVNTQGFVGFQGNSLGVAVGPAQFKLIATVFMDAAKLQHKG